MSILDILGHVVSVDTILSLATGILAGQKLRITLDGNKIGAKAPSPRASGKRGKRTTQSASAPVQSPSPQDPELPYMVDPGS